MIHRGLRPLKLSRSLVSCATGCMKHNMAAELRHHLRSGRLIITGSIERIRKVCLKFDDKGVQICSVRLFTLERLGFSMVFIVLPIRGDCALFIRFDSKGLALPPLSGS